MSLMAHLLYFCTNRPKDTVIWLYKGWKKYIEYSPVNVSGVDLVFFKRKLKVYTISTSSSVLHLWKSLGFLHNILPFKLILDLFRLFYKFHLSQIIPDVVFPSGLGPSHWSTCRWFPFVYFPYDISSKHSVCVSKRTQLLGFNFFFLRFVDRASQYIYLSI